VLLQVAQAVLTYFISCKFDLEHSLFATQLWRKSWCNRSISKRLK